jgi:hypothetical protein
MLEAIDCDMCHKALTYDNTDMDVAPILLIGPGMIYYPTKNIGSYNGAEVHMECVVRWQIYMLSEGFIKFDS